MEEQYITTSLAVTLSHRNVQKDAETLKEVVKGKYLEALSMDIRKKKTFPTKGISLSASRLEMVIRHSSSIMLR